MDGPWTDSYVDYLEHVASIDRFGSHELVDEPEVADVVLFVQCHMVDWRLRAIRRHPAAQAHWGKVMVFDERDRPWRSFPGIYVSTDKSSFDVRRQRSWSYLRAPSNPAPDVEPDLLFSFVGSRTARCRSALFDLRHPEGVIEEVTRFMFWDETSPQYAERRRRFSEVLSRSRFVLCPRGRGTSSIRLYEAIAAGRVPVIISDDWVEPAGPDWGTFSLRIPESRAHTVADVVEAHRDDWPAMSASASAAHQAYFSESATFHRVVDLLDDLRGSTPRNPSRFALGLRAPMSSVKERLPKGSYRDGGALS
jgi:hypothetical protein